MLSTEPHSFSRVFTAGFLEAVAGMLFKISASPTPADVVKVTKDAGRLLLEAVANAPIVPEYFSQIAAHMVEAASATPYRDAIKSAFVRRGILSLTAAAAADRPGAAVSPRRGIASMAGEDADREASAPVPQVPLDARRLGMDIGSIVVESPGQTKRIAARSATLAAVGTTTSPSHEAAAQAFVEDLFQRGRVAMDEIVPSGGGTRGVTVGRGDSQRTFVRHTHELRQQGDQVVLVRRHFDCGFDSY
jgi:hypothetical protein